jgi:hypothetical protein
MFRSLSLSAVALAAVVSARAAGADDDLAQKQVALKQGDRIVFFGDSLTALAGIDGPRREASPKVTSASSATRSRRSTRTRESR